MDYYKFENTVSKLTKYGIAHRDELRHFSASLEPFLKKGMVKKIFVRGKVFYAFTEKAVPFLDDYRQGLLARVKTLREGFPRTKVYSALLGDLRFLDENHPIAEAFRFLGDWQLKERVVPSQLALAKAKYFDLYKSRDHKD